jgi:hypothetical protein
VSHGSALRKLHVTVNWTAEAFKEFVERVKINTVLEVLVFSFSSCWKSVPSAVSFELLEEMLTAHNYTLRRLRLTHRSIYSRRHSCVPTRIASIRLKGATRR